MKYLCYSFLLTICACNSPTESKTLDSIISRTNEYSFNISEKDSDIHSCFKFMKDNNIAIEYLESPEVSIMKCALSKAENRYLDSWDIFYRDNYELFGGFLKNNYLSEFIKSNGVQALEKKIKENFFPLLEKELGIQEVEFTIMNSHKIIGNFSFNKSKITDYKKNISQIKPSIILNIVDENVEINSKWISFGNKVNKYPIGTWRTAKLKYGNGITIIMESITYAYEVMVREKK